MQLPNLINLVMMKGAELQEPERVADVVAFLMVLHAELDRLFNEVEALHTVIKEEVEGRKDPALLAQRKAEIAEIRKKAGSPRNTPHHPEPQADAKTKGQGETQ